jgi:glycogen(starch) synthase
VISERSTDPWKSRLHRTVDRFLSLFTSRIVANSAPVSQSLVAAGIPAAKTAVIPNGIDTTLFRPRDAASARQSLGLDAPGPLFGYIGRLAFEKRPQVFIEVAKAVLEAVPGSKAVLFGDGPMLEELKAAASVCAGRIIFFGDCPSVELAHAALDCLVLTSAWEGFPNAVLEAFASARPVVAVRMPATAELIDNHITGILAHDDVPSISDAVTYVLTHPAVGRDMGLAARAKAERMYSMASMVAAWQRIYSEALPGRHLLEGTP